MAQYDVDLRDYWRIIRKRKASILFMVLLVGLCSYGFAKFREPAALYEAHSAIKIDRFSNLASILTGGYWRQAENMETHAYIITSHPVLKSAAEALGWAPPGSAAAGPEDPAAAEEIQRLKRMVEAKTQEGTHIINIRAVSDDPRQSARVANALAHAYRDYSIQQSNKKTFETKTFIEEQLRLTRERLKQAELELQRFKEQNGLIALDAQTANTLTKLNALELEHERAKADRVEIENQLKAVEAAGKGQNERLMGIVMTAPAGSPLEQLRGKLGDLNLKRQTLLISLTEKHPQVEDVTRQIQAVYAEVRKDLQSMLQVAAGRESELARRVELVHRENMSLPEKGQMLVRLQREADLQQSLYTQLKGKYQEVLIQESGKVEEVSVVKPAVAPAHPFNVPSKLMIVLTGVVMGLIIGVVLAFLAEVFDTSMGTIEDVEELLKVPVLGVIPQLDSDPKRKGRPERGDTGVRNRSRDLVTHYEPKSQAAESFRALRANLQFLRVESKGKLFLITSSFIQEGKTLNVVNLALSMAQAGNKVLLVDADLRKPNVHRVFGLQREPGVTDYVLGNYHWREVVGSISDVMLGDFAMEDILQTPGLDNLHFVTAGTKPPNPTEILSSERFREFLREAKQVYDFIFVDAPPILPVADATEIAPLMDGVFLVYTVGRIGRGVLKRAKSNLDNVEAKVLGVVLNNVKPEAGPDYFRYHSHYYYGPDTAGLHPGAGSLEGRGFRWPSALAKAFGLVAFVMALSAFTIGVLWQELPAYLPEWLLPYAQTLFSN